MLQSLLGEIPVHTGKIRVNGTLSYASQEPWVFSGSVRHNILFGEPFDEDRYQRVIHACALDHDIKVNYIEYCEPQELGIDMKAFLSFTQAFLTFVKLSAIRLKCDCSLWSSEKSC